MADFDIKSQLDLLNEFLDREMESIKTDYFVVKPDGRGNGGNRPTIVDGHVNSWPRGYNKDRTLPPPSLRSWKAFRSNSVSFPQTVAEKRSKAIDIIDPDTGEKVQL